ncbi:putative sperm flagellar protein 1-like [Apostichopus japonicus]|uniref:Putative sperm flagellar protein 1-like n=1 Tax=Stichopus japonicus TaxID=307972 RepID=A0A2G8JI60_STIJA|nr:putative sperm flagellar protein 1-like [Apostichopus japonicus]
MKDTDSKDEMTALDDQQLQELYAWVDEITLSRPKRNITRDFSDGVLVAEVVHFFIPRIVELHNYTPANSTMQKMGNWGTLNRKVFTKINFNIPESVIRSICNCKAGVIEVILLQLRQKIEKYLGKNKPNMSPDGYYGGQEVGSFSDRSEKHKRKLVPAGKPPKHAAPAPKAPTVHHHSPPSNLAKARSLTHINRSDLPPEIRDLLDEKEQALLASQETVQILQAKVRRLENLLHLKDVRIEEVTKKMQQYDGRY